MYIRKYSMADTEPAKIEPAKTEPVKVDTPAESIKTDVPIDDPEMMTLSKDSFVEMQKNIINLEKKAESAEKEKDETARLSVYGELLSINKKLAKLNEKSSIEMLKGALQAAKEIKSGFATLNPKDKPVDKANESNHDSMKYDFVKKKYVFA